MLQEDDQQEDDDSYEAMSEEMWISRRMIDEAIARTHWNPNATQNQNDNNNVVHKVACTIQKGLQLISNYFVPDGNYYKESNDDYY